ncbi:unnamed protein product [Schistocephalus solidus]|uniref:Uncharacterized protein n=1 Tax=Schistocephalus solidus TaxID=70667 RepID=A0A183TGB5_SCHSO|nr:unnamed protein product [Schistocephalus solidus]
MTAEFTTRPRTLIPLCTPSAPAILTATATPTTMNDSPQPLPISLAHTAPETSTYASAWSVTCESIARRLVNHYLGLRHSIDTPASTALTTPAHLHIAWAYSVTCASMTAEFTTRPTTLIPLCTLSAPAILTATATPTTINDIPQPLPISLAPTAPETSTQASAWSVTCESIARRLVNQCLGLKHTVDTPASTALTAPAHLHTAWAY